MKRYMKLQIESVIAGLKIQLMHLFDCTIWSSIVTPFVYVILAFLGFTKRVVLYDEYVFFAIILLVSIDTLIGIKKWLKLKKFNDKKVLTGAFEKLFLCTMVMLLFNVISIRLEKKEDLQVWVSLFTFMIVISYPVGSILKNIFFISNGKYPPIGFMRKWNNYEDTANIEEIFKAEASKADTKVPEEVT